MTDAIPALPIPVLPVAMALAALDALPQPIAVCDARGIVLGVNRAWEAFTVMPRAQLIGRAFSDLYAAFVLDAALPGSANERTIRWQRTDGRVFDARVSETHFPPTCTATDGDDVNRGLTGPSLMAGRLITIVDCTERERVEHVDEVWREQLDLVLRATDAALWDLDFVNRTAYFSDRFKSMLGYSEETDLSTRAVFDQWLHPADRLRVLEAQRQHLEDDRPYELEYRLRHRNGSYRWIHGRGVTTRDASGAPVRFFGAAIDITARREAEHGLRAREQHYRELVETSENLVWMLDPSGRFTFVNRRGALAVLGYEPDEIVGQHFSVFAAGADPNQDLVRFDEIMLSRGVSTIETRWRRKDGQNVFVTINVAVTRDAQGHNVAALGTASDVTERVIREKALRDANRLANEAARSKAEFLATMSHELRTPLNGVIASTELLCGTMLSIEQAEYVATIQTSGESLLAVINDVLDLSKIEAGRVDLERTPFVLEGMIDAVVDILGERAREKGLELLYDLAASVPAVVSGDAARLRQIVLNLVANAVKFTHSGLVRVSVDALAATADAITVEISVSDTGIGMDQTTLDRLFQPFSQADSSTTRRYGGTGLGLAISKRLAIMMGGGIRAQSSLHRGSTFTVTVRLGVADANTAAVSELGGSDANLDALRAALAGKRIVMIDPLPARRALLLGWLRPWAAQVRVVESFEPRCDLRVDGVVPDAVVVVTAGGIADSAVAQADHEFRGVKSAAVALNVPILWLAGQSRGRLVAARATDPSAAQTIELLTRPVRRRVLLVALERLIARSGVAGEVPARHDARSTLAPPAGARTIAATGATLGSTVGSTTEPISAPAAKIGAGFCVLVAEDHEINQRIAIRMLQKLGCQVDLAVNGREALSRATLTQYDIVFMDMQMPEMDGVQATRAIRTAVGPADAPPIVAMTANALAEDRSRCLIAGMQDFLTKPINGASLERALVEWARPRYLARTSPLFDARQLDGLRALGADRARHVVALYVHDTTDKLERLRAALALGDHATIVAISHSVYGASSTLGALRAACIAQSLEAAARADDDIAMTAQIASLAGAVAETIVGLPRLFMPVDALGASLGHSLAPSL